MTGRDHPPQGTAGRTGRGAAGSPQHGGAGSSVGTWRGSLPSRSVGAWTHFTLRCSPEDPCPEGLPACKADASGPEAGERGGGSKASSPSAHTEPQAALPPVQGGPVLNTCRALRGRGKAPTASGPPPSCWAIAGRLSEVSVAGGVCSFREGAQEV